jgi:5-methylcytosine-specific restriction endonuclease McrA
VSQGRRTKPLPRGWARIRERILKRDGYQCQQVFSTGRKCGERATHVDHIKPAAQGGADGDANLQALCAYCHGIKTGREGGKAAAAKPRPTRKRPPEAHPGMRW